MLGRAGKGDVAFHAPWSPAGMEGRALILVGILGNEAAATGLVRLHPIDLLLGDAVEIVDEALAVRQGQHLAAQLTDLLRRVRGGIARTTEDRPIADTYLPLSINPVIQVKE